MSEKVQKTTTNPCSSLYHYFLIKILVEDELNIRHDSWANFLSWNGFINVVRVHQDKRDIQRGLEEEISKRVVKVSKEGDFFSSYPKKSHKMKDKECTMVIETLVVVPQNYKKYGKVTVVTQRNPT